VLLASSTTLRQQNCADAVRVVMYRTPRDVPFLVEQAFAGDFSPFAEDALRANRGVDAGSRTGLSYCIACNEFVKRIHPPKLSQRRREVFSEHGEFRTRWQRARTGRQRSLPLTIYISNVFEGSKERACSSAQRVALRTAGG